MKEGRRKTEDIIRTLRHSEGLSVDEAYRLHGISPQTYHRYKKKYGGLDVKEAQRLLELRKENAELKKFLADLDTRRSKVYSQRVDAFLQSSETASLSKLASSSQFVASQHHGNTSQ